MTLPTRPTHLAPLAELCLKELVAKGLGRCFSLGGAVGLLHFLDYRLTNDLDAWWPEDVTGEEIRAVEETIRSTLAQIGEVRVRRWGDVVSLELLEAGKKSFSFQIARRSSRLRPPIDAGWIDVALDDFDDLVASKMVALIERGAPRDLRDVFAVCTAGLASPSSCWSLWRAKMQLEERDASVARGRAALATHLERLATLRPLEKIENLHDRKAAKQLRFFFAQEFPDALVD